MRQLVCLAGLVIALGHPTARADEFSVASYRDIEVAYRAQNEEIDGLRTRLAAIESSAARAGDSGNGCCNCNCDCCSSCCPLASCSGWIGGGDILFLKPHWETNSALAVRTVAGINSTTTNIDFDYDFETAYSVWAGYRGCSGFGARTRYFEFDHSSSLTFAPGVNQAVAPATPLGLSVFFFGGAGSTYDAASNLELRSVDIECSQILSICGFTIDASAGVRYFQMDQHFDMTSSWAPVGTSVLHSAHDFEGIGPTLALEVRRDVGDSGWTLFGNARASILFGDAEQVVNEEVRNPLGTLVASLQATNSRCDVISVGEVEVGAEYARWVGSARWFARTSLVGQIYNGAGNASNNELFVTSGTDETLDNGANLGLFGWRIGAGVNY